MSKSSLYLPAPAFGLTWFESGKDSLAYVLMPGGGGSSKTGVKNQIMLASMNPGAALEEQVKLLDGHLTDTEKESNFCSGISYGMMFVRDRGVGRLGSVLAHFLRVRSLLRFHPGKTCCCCCF